MADAWPDLPGLPPIGPSVAVPGPGPRILVPVAAALLALAGLVLVPWQVRGDSLLSVAWSYHQHGPRDFGDV